MPDENKLKVFEETQMTIFKSCILCRHGEIPSHGWGFCKLESHFYYHLGRNQKLPGVAHAAMGCSDFTMKHEHSREMVELGPYLELIPVHDVVIEEVGVEEDEEPVEMHFKGGDLPPLESHDPFDDDEDTTEADFEEACRLTDSAVADAHADDEEEIDE